VDVAELVSQVRDWSLDGGREVTDIIPNRFEDRLNISLINDLGPGGIILAEPNRIGTGVVLRTPLDPAQKDTLIRLVLRDDQPVEGRVVDPVLDLKTATLTLSQLRRRLPDTPNEWDLSEWVRETLFPLPIM